MRSLEELTYRGQASRIRQLAVEALAKIDAPWDSLRLIFHGENTTFRAHHSSGDYLVRVHRPGYQNPRTIRSELELLRAIRAQTDVLAPVPASEVMRLEAPGVERRNVVVFHWMHGQFRNDFTRHGMARLGRTAAELHLFAEGFVPSDGFDRMFATVEGMTGENMGGSLQDWPAETRGFVEEVVERAAWVLDDLGRDRDVWGIVHNDLHHGNRLVTAGGRLGVIDFDDCAFGHYMADIAVMLGFPFHTKPDVYPELADAYFAAYRELRPISDDEIATLPAFLVLRRVMITLWVIGRAVDNPYFADRAPNEVERSIRVLHDLNDLAW